MFRIAVLDDYQGKAHEFADWTALGGDVETVFFHDPIEEASLASALGDYDALVLMRERTAFPTTVLEQLAKLRLLVTTGMNNASVDLAYLRDRGVVVCGTGGGARGGVGLGATVELAWALIFAVTKRTALEDRAIRNGGWQVGFPSMLAGSTLGLAGLGRIGSSMVAPARAFGMEVIAWSPNLSEERADEHGVTKVSKERLFSESDVLSIHLVLSETTRGLFGSADLARMRPSAVLINTSRGPIVDEDALVDALRSDTIAGAGLDVFDHEPLPKHHVLRTLDNAVVSPHLGYVSEAGMRSMYGQVLEDLQAYLGGQPVRLIE